MLNEAGAVKERVLRRLLSDNLYRVVSDTLAKGNKDSRDTRGLSIHSNSSSKRSTNRSRSISRSRKDASRDREVSRNTRQRKSGTSASSMISIPELNVLPTLFANMSCSDWKLRCEAIDDLKELVLAHPNAIVGKQARKVVDNIVSRLGDGNTKVNIIALEATIDIVPTMPTEFRAQAHSLVRAN